jgi:type I restriction enzyme, R subunit
MAAEIIIAGISATLQAVDLWLSERDRRRAHRAFEAAYPRINTDLRLKAEARQLEALVPARVLENMQKRVERCWKSYNDILEDEDGYLPKEVDDATVAVRKCICRELRRLYDLNGRIPPGTLAIWWEQYCKT